MEATVLPGDVCRLQTLNPLPPLSLPVLPLISFDVASRARKRSRFVSTATALVAELSPLGGSVSVPKRHSTSYPARRTAIVEVLESNDLIAALNRLDEVLKVQDLNVILRNIGTQGRWQHLSQLFSWMQSRGKTSASTYSSYIKFIGRNSATKALEFYYNIPDESAKTNVFIFNSVLSSLVKNRKFDQSIKLFDRMKRDGLIPDAVTYNTLLAGCIKAENGYPRALELVKELRDSKIQMDVVMYGTILAICASNGKYEEAQSFFYQMKEEGHSPNLYHYSSLLNSLSTRGDYKAAEELLLEMKSAGLEPNKVILTTLLKVYVRGGLFDKSKELLAKLEKMGHAEDEIPFCLLMDGLAKAGHLDEARLLFEEMRQKGVRSDGYSHSIIISALCRNELFEEAKELAKDFEMKYDKYDLVMLNTMLCAYCRAGEMESVMQTMKKMDELALSPDYNTFHILIRYFYKEKLYLLAYRTLTDMYGKGHQPKEELCSPLISQLGKIKAHAEAFAVYKILRYSKRTMCKKLHEEILQILIAGKLLKDAYVVVKDNARLISPPIIRRFATAYIKFGNINLINDVIKVIHGSGHKINERQFGMAVRRYVTEPEKKELFLQLLRWMPSQGYAVDSPTRNLIIKHSHLFGRQLIAEIMSKHHITLTASRPR